MQMPCQGEPEDHDERHKSGLTKMKTKCMYYWIVKLNMTKRSLLSTLTYKFNIISMK